MKLTVVAVGHRMPDWVKIAWEDYTKRLPVDWALRLCEIAPDRRTTGKTPAQMMATEARRIEAALPAGALRVALDERGRDLSTIALSKKLQQWQDNNQNIAFLIGGPDGLDSMLKGSCTDQVRLSSLTLPHAMVRVVLAEQLYRAWTILTHHPYHRA